MEKDVGEISTHPTLNDWTAYIVGFPIFTAIASILPLLLVQSHYVHTPDGTAPAWQIIGILVICAAVAFWFISRLVNRHYWKLTQTELIAGMIRNIRYPLTSIEKIVVGLPNEMPIPGTGPLVSPESRESYATKQANSLLVQFRDGGLLPLKLRAMGNGSALMDELLYRLSDRVVWDYVYSEKEIKILRRAIPNILIRRR